MERLTRNGDAINVLAIVKGQERYIYLYHDDQRADLLRHLGKQATNQDLSLTWYDAAVLAQKIRAGSKT
jgi:hypothetical protein